MFINKLHRSRKYIVGCLLVAFSTVFICDYLCDVGIIEVGIYSGEGIKKAHKSSIDREHDHFWSVTADQEAEEHDHVLNSQKKSDGHQHNGSAEDECCKEESGFLYATLIKSESTQFFLVKVPLLLQNIEFLSFSTYIYYNSNNLQYINSSLSPPGGAFMRILLQSFLC